MLKRYRTYNGSNKYKIRNPYYNNKGTFVYGVSLELSEDVSAHKNVTCFDGNDGSITVIASGGASPYMYSLNSDFSDYNTTGVFSGLSITGPIEEGTDEYGGIIICDKTIYAKDANNRTGQITVKLQSPVELEWMNCPENIVTYCDEGQNYATVVPGVDFTEPTLSTRANIPSEYYEWYVYNNLHANNQYGYLNSPYEITYTANNSCGEYGVICPFTITVLQGNPLVLTENTSAHTDVTCFDGDNGSITVQASGGQSPYIYSTDPTFATYNSTGVFDNLYITGPVTEGTDQYGGILICTKTFYVKDVNNVVSSIDVQLKSPVELEWVNVPSNITVYCDEGENYATLIPGVDFQEPKPSTTANGVGDNITHTAYPNNNEYIIGMHELMYETYSEICDEWPDNCSFIITVLQGNPLTLTENTSLHHNVTCFDGGDGSITVQASGGVAPYVYSMDSTFATSQSSPTFDNLFITGPVTESTDEYGGILICTKTIYVKDANDMVSSVDVQLQSPVEMQWVGGPTEEVVVYCDEGEDYATIIPGVTYPIPTLTQTATITGSIIQPEEPWTQAPSQGQITYNYSVKDICVPGRTKTSCVFSVRVLASPNNE